MRRRALHGVVGLVVYGLVAGTAVARADVVLDWNTIMMSTLATQNPFAQARFAAITETAVFEAVNAITGDDDPYLGTVTAPPGASAEAAAAAAAHSVLTNYFPASAMALDAALMTSLAAIPDGQAKDDGVAVGEAAAAAMIADRTNDGSAPPQLYTPTSTDPGQWQLTPGCTAGIFLHWRDLKPFGVLRTDQFRPGPPPALTSGLYTKVYDEVKTVGAVDSTVRPQDRTDVARFFAVASAPYVWNLTVNQVSAAEERSLSENARTLALLNMALSDGLASVMEAKYHYVFWRPVTAIRAGDTDGNPRTDADPTWTPLISTPCFPSYPSAHAVASYAARKVAEKTLDSGPIDVMLSHPGVPDVTLHYARFSQITDDIDDARVFGGIHFRSDQDVGGMQGRDIGGYVYHHNLRPR
jgi:hypothetical protein